MTGSNRPSIQTHAQLIHSIRGWQDVPQSPGDNMNQLRPNKKRQCVATTSSINLFIAYPTRPIFYSNGFENFLLKVSPSRGAPSCAIRSPPVTYGASFTFRSVCATLLVALSTTPAAPEPHSGHKTRTSR